MVNANKAGFTEISVWLKKEKYSQVKGITITWREVLKPISEFWENSQDHSFKSHNTDVHIKLSTIIMLHLLSNFETIGTFKRILPGLCITRTGLSIHVFFSLLLPSGMCVLFRNESSRVCRKGRVQVLCKVFIGQVKFVFITLCFTWLTSFIGLLILFSSMTWHFSTLPKILIPCLMTMASVNLASIA